MPSGPRPLFLIPLALILPACDPAGVEPGPGDASPTDVVCDGVLEGTVMLSSDEDVQNLVGTTRITGDLIIGSYSCNCTEWDLPTTLAGLECLEEVDGNVMVGYWGPPEKRAANLTGLESLRRVGGDLGVAHDIELRDLDGLGALERIEGSLDLQSSALIDINGLRALSHVGEDLQVLAPGLESFEPLGGLLGVGGDISLASDAATHLDGMKWLVDASNVHLDLPALRTLDGISNLRSVSGTLTLQSVGVEDLDGLDKLESAGSVYVGNNLALRDVSALANVQVESRASFLENPRLSSCQIDALAGWWIANGFTGEVVAGSNLEQTCE